MSDTPRTETQLVVCKRYHERVCNCSRSALCADCSHKHPHPFDKSCTHASKGWNCLTECVPVPADYDQTQTAHDRLKLHLAAAQKELAECKAKLDRATRCIETLLHCPNRCSSGTCGCESQAEGWAIAEGGK